MSDQFVVIVLETESDFPGVDRVYGPLDRLDADVVAEEVAELTNTRRGEHVQVCMIRKWPAAS